MRWLLRTSRRFGAFWLTVPCSPCGAFSRAGVFKGRDEFLRGVGQLVEASGGTLRVELLDTFVNGAHGDQVIGRHHRTGTVKGEPVDEHNAFLMTCANGVIVSLVDFYGHPATVERVWD